MSEKSDLQLTIRGCNEKIGLINADIDAMKQEQNTFGGYAKTFAYNQQHVHDYDMTVGDTWRRTLCEEAQTKQTALASAIGTATSACSQVITDLGTCITNAQAEITKYEKIISSCQARIEEIEAAERAAAEEQSSSH